MSYLPHITPPERLYSAIVARIREARVRSARLHLTGLLALSGVLGLGLAAAIQYAAQEFYASGFSSYLTLMFDSGARGYMGDLVYSLAESVPSLALLILFALGGAFMWSAVRTARTARLAFS